MSVVVVTGASTGIGRACADLLHAKGHVVYGLSRSIEQLVPKPPFRVRNVDITRADHVSAFLAELFREQPQLDALVNCAGFVLAGPVEETSDELARRQLETNFFATAAMCRAVLPRLKAQGRGTLINVSSLAAYIPMAFQAYYSASKAALTAFSRALRLELLPFGVKVVSVDPGDFATPITAARTLSIEPVKSSYPAFARTLDVIRRDEQGAAPPDEVAHLVLRLVESRNPPPVALVGQFIQKRAVFLRALLPARFFDWLLCRLYRL